MDRGESRRKATGVAAECSLCLDEFLDTGKSVPRNLLCGHTYCSECICKLIFYKANTRPEVDCPKCHHITPVPDGEVGKLPRNYALIDVISTSAYSDITTPQFDSHAEEAVVGPVCDVHGDHIISYCLQDDVLVCSSCQLYGIHKGHQCLLVPEASEHFHSKLCQLNPEIGKKKEKMEELLERVEETRQAVEKKGGSVLDAVDHQFSLLTAAIEKRRKEMRVEVLERTQVRVHTLVKQAAELKDSMERAACVYSQTARLIHEDNYTLLKDANLTLEKVEAVFTNPPSALLSAEADLTFESSKDVLSDLTSLIAEFGVVRSVPGCVKTIRVNEYHDGFRIFWDGHNLADNEGISYHLQVLMGEYQEDQNEYFLLYRGGNRKFTWKTDLQEDVTYKFRVQVRTTEGVGCWCDPVTAVKAKPGFRWHESRRHTRVELSPDRLEAHLLKGSSGVWGTLAGNELLESGQLYAELNILDISKSRSGKDKVVLGVIECTPSTINSIIWTECLGRMDSSQSFSYCPMAGTKHCQLFPDGKLYTSSIQLEAGDRFGMLVDMDDGSLSFFHNGMDLGKAFDAIRAKYLLPAVSIRDKARIQLCFPPPPFSRRDPKVVRLSSFGVASQSHRKRV